jgi:inner membrane protein YidH
VAAPERDAPSREPDLAQDRDASRRTRLANERTYLAWWRTGLATMAVSLGVGRLLPAVAKGTTWPYAALGVAFALLGVTLVAYGFIRLRDVERHIARGSYAPPHDRFMFFITAAGVILGILLIAVVVVPG